MTTTPAVPVVTAAVVSTEVSKISTYIKAHEKLIVIVLCLAAAIFAYQKGAGLIESYFQHKDNIAHATLQAQVDTVKAQALNNAAEDAQYQRLAQQLTTANASLAAAIAQRNVVTVKQQAVDKTLAPADLATRWAGLLHAPASDIQATAAGIAVTPPVATQTVVALDSIPGLEANLVDETTTAANLKEQLTNVSTLNSGLNKQIDGLNSELVDQTKVCTVDKNLLKAQARKSKLHWFLGGVVTGFVFRQIIKSTTGI